MLPSDLQSGWRLTEDGSPLLHVVSEWANSIWALEVFPGSDIHTSPAVAAGSQVRLQSELPPGFSQTASPHDRGFLTTWELDFQEEHMEKESQTENPLCVT